MRPLCLFVHRGFSTGPRAISDAANNCRSLVFRPALQPRPYSTAKTPKPPVAMSFSLPRVQKNGGSTGGPDFNKERSSSPNREPDSSSPQTGMQSPDGVPLSSVYDTMSKATIIGRTGGLPELKELPSGIRLIVLRLATNHLVGSGPAQRVETQWHTVQVYDGVTGFNIVSSLPVGTQLYVEGALRISTYEKDGNTKQYINITVNKSIGLFRILRRPYRQNNSASPDGNETSPAADNFPF